MSDETTLAPLTIFVVHPSDLLTDHRTHGDGLIAHGFLRELERRGHRLHVACGEVDLARPFSSRVTVHPLRRRLPGPLRWIEYTVRARSLFDRLRRAERIDVVHQLNPVFPGLSLAVAGTGVPVVLGTYVASWPSVPGRGLAARLARAVKSAVLGVQQRRAAALLATTEIAVRDRIVDDPAVRARVRPQKHGIAIELFRAAAAVPREATAARRVLFLANLDVRKGVFTLLDAFANVHARVPDATLRIVGDGQVLPQVRERITELGLAEVVELAGPARREDVPGVMRQAAIYCLPSFGEPYATSVLEAMASALPVVVTRAGGLTELVDDAGGYRVPQRDATALADALVALLASPERAAAMGEHNRRRAEEEFTWTEVGATLEAVYRDVARASQPDLRAPSRPTPRPAAPRRTEAR